MKAETKIKRDLAKKEHEEWTKSVIEYKLKEADKYIAKIKKEGLELRLQITRAARAINFIFEDLKQAIFDDRYTWDYYFEMVEKLEGIFDYLDARIGNNFIYLNVVKDLKLYEFKSEKSVRDNVLTHYREFRNDYEDRKRL